MFATHDATDPSLAVDGSARATAPSVKDCRMTRSALCIAPILVKSVSVVDIFARKTVRQVRERAQGTVPSNVQLYVTMDHVAYPVQNHAHLVQSRARGHVHTFAASSPALL
jgi:hypothetical protein